METRDSDRELLRHGFRLDALDEWRRGVDRELTTLRRDVTEMAKADEFAAKLATEMGKQRNRMFSRTEKLVGAGTALIVSVCSIVGLILQVHG